MLQDNDAVQQRTAMNEPLEEATRLIRELELTPHPEGGHYRETFRDAPGSDGRALSTAIYFLLHAGEVSHWHRIDAAETWHYHRGAPLELKIADGSSVAQSFVLGAAIEHGERPQIVVPPHAWQSARSLGEYTLVGCTVAPGFEFSKFELADEGFEPGQAAPIDR
jgi:predicted cupin superfamily sugar epimerase